LRHPRGSTLFPYTTLFRSFDDLLKAAHRLFPRDVPARLAGERFRDEEGLRKEALDAPGPGHDDLVLVGELVHAQDGDDVLELPVDRKSTRLNSSHVKISYA